MLGVAGIVAGIVFFAFSLAPLGIRERVSIYPLMLWQIVAGLALLWVWRGWRNGATTERDTGDGDAGRVPWTLLVSAYLVPVMIVTQFAWLATMPVLVLLLCTLRNVRGRLVRWLAVLLAVVYATPYAIWKLRPDPAPSLSKDMDPVFAALIIAASVAFIVAIHRTGKRSPIWGIAPESWSADNFADGTVRRGSPQREEDR